jgi:hypothetical protein
VRGWKGHGQSASAPDAPLNRDPVEAWGDEKRDAFFVEIASTLEKSRGNGRR